MFLGRNRKARIHLTARVDTDICATLLRQAGLPGFFFWINKDRQQVNDVWRGIMPVLRGVVCVVGVVGAAMV
jgi:hypothetical protein